VDSAEGAEISILYVNQFDVPASLNVSVELSHYLFFYFLFPFQCPGGAESAVIQVTASGPGFEPRGSPNFFFFNLLCLFYFIVFLNFYRIYI
jgi:hypothetical protein